MSRAPKTLKEQTAWEWKFIGWTSLLFLGVGIAYALWRGLA